MGLNQNVLNVFKNVFRDDAKISRVSESLRGKVITIYGDNNLGKTRQSSRFKNPIFLPCEKGMNAVNGALVLRTRSWSDLKRNVAKLTSNKKLLGLLENGETITIIVDGAERMGNYCKNYLCSKYNVSNVGDANNGYGCWSEYEDLMWSLIDSLISVGYTVVFLAHRTFSQETNRYEITGDSRVIKPIKDNSDIIAYLEGNGVDENGNEIPSSAYFVATEDFYARTRYDYMVSYIKEFTAENFEQAVVEGIKKQNEHDGVSGVSFEEQQEIYKDDESYEDVMEELQELYEKLNEINDEDLFNQYIQIVEDNLGVDAKISEATERQLEPLKCIRNELTELLDKEEVE